MSIVDINNFKIENSFNTDKVNIGALGNMVPQLHMHIIGRYKNDRAWPGPIWGTISKDDKPKIEDMRGIFKELFSSHFTK